jgi:tetratricopeptide (TPR) repeat protein
MPDYWLDFNDKWNYHDPEFTEKVFRDILKNASGKGLEYVLQLKTQIARTFSLRNKFDKAHALLDEVQAAMPKGSLVEVRYLLERGRTFNSAKQPEKALLLFSEASALAQKLGADFFTIDALHMLGVAAPQVSRLDWDLKAIETAEHSTDVHAQGWLATLYNNAGWALFDEKRYTESLDLFQKAVPLREQKGDAENLRIAMWCVARVLRALGRTRDALDILRAIHPQAEDGYVDEEIAECLVSLGKPDEAKPYFANAYTRLKDDSSVAEDTSRLARLKELGRSV